jgi:uncharacterized short protein YbdD (DUF466 family)
MLVYKALYRKMMDDLKDAGMWLDWAEQMLHCHPDYAEFLIESAEERLDKTFIETYRHFERYCDESKSEICMDEVVHDHMMEWHHAMKLKAETLEEKLKSDDDDHSDKHPAKK